MLCSEPEPARLHVYRRAEREGEDVKHSPEPPSCPAGVKLLNQPDSVQISSAVTCLCRATVAEVVLRL